MDYTLEELNERIGYLQSISPANASTMFGELKSTIKTYLNCDEEFELQVNKTLDKVIACSFHSHLRYENQELLEPWQNASYSGEIPQGFDDVRELFVLDEVFEEMMSVSDEAFLIAFFSVQVDENGETISGGSSGGGSGSQGTPELHNKYVDDWIAKLIAGMAAELAGLKSIMQSCANRSYSTEWALLFEDLGKCTNRRHVKTFARDIFYERGYGWLVETFHLNHVYRPSYSAELPDWVESDTTTYVTTFDMGGAFDE